MDQHEELDWGVAGCYLFDLMVDIVPQMFHTASNWLTLGECCWLLHRLFVRSRLHKLGVTSELLLSSGLLRYTFNIKSKGFDVANRILKILEGVKM